MKGAIYLSRFSSHSLIEDRPLFISFKVSTIHRSDKFHSSKHCTSLIFRTPWVLHYSFTPTHIFTLTKLQFSNTHQPSRWPHCWALNMISHTITHALYIIQVLYFTVIWTLVYHLKSFHHQSFIQDSSSAHQRRVW